MTKHRFLKSWTAVIQNPNKRNSYPIASLLLNILLCPGAGQILFAKGLEQKYFTLKHKLIQCGAIFLAINICCSILFSFFMCMFVMFSIFMLQGSFMSLGFCLSKSDTDSCTAAITLSAILIPAQLCICSIFIIVACCRVGFCCTSSIHSIFLIKEAQRYELPIHEYLLSDEFNGKIEEVIGKGFVLQYDRIEFSNEHVLGSGASGQVYKGYYFDMPIAIKVYLKNTFGVENDLKEFFTEAQLLSERSNHPNIVRFIGVAHATDKNSIYLCMEYCSFGNLASFMQNREMDWNMKLNLLIGIASGMNHLHSYNIIHRDLKLENILMQQVDCTFVPKITDFGFSKKITPLNALENSTLHVGTASYCAPEVLLHQTTQYNEKVDSYSFAIIMWTLFYASRFPYGEVSDIFIISTIQSNPNYRPVIQNHAAEFDWYFVLMQQCWHTDPSQRPSFEEILLELKKHR